jgi:broad specificity phosphatase PhoE
MVLWFETHATSVDNEAGLASGWYDVELSARGVQQARELGQRRSESGLTAIYCSDLRRSYDTAHIAFPDTEVAITHDGRLRECDYGDLTRRPVAEIDAHRTRAVHTAFPRGESYADVTRRVGAWLEEVRTRHGSGTLLVIGHRATFYALEHLFRGRSLEDAVAARWQWQPGWRYQLAARA